MTTEPLISQQVKPADKFLWAVKTYIDLISRDDPLVYGSGLKRLYTMASGVDTLNESDIKAITAKSEQLDLIPQNLHGFMTSSILKNIELYGKELQRVINHRVIGISNGDIRNPDPLFKFSSDEARRHYYTPPNTFLVRLQKALVNDHGLDGYRFAPPQVVTIQDVANDAESTLVRMQIDEGHLTPSETSWMALLKAVEELIGRLELEARYPVPDRDYKIRARGALKILWFIAKLLVGDLSAKPLRKDINVADLSQKYNFSDGTLASIPFPLQNTMELFSDDDHLGVSMKGRTYLSAVSAASFYRSQMTDADG